ncbi:DUF4328 domain-containing protein [Streptacidiphilus melanogenes]|uniref:DUF4328 domain-containing protein n=1 Tax=Streptacidiphilus melanogenes TaxID=411235 RepID=UPI0005A6F54C|nr:DUF4328 domain-containing protein [Streptacidiphilus melanogenes]
MLCPSCSAAALDAYGRCPHCGFSAAPPVQPYAAYYPRPTLISPTAPAGVGLAAQILIAVAGLAALISFGLNIWAFTVAKAAYDAGPANVDTDAVTAAGGVAGILVFFSLLLGLATGIVFIVWFYKSANLAAILAPGRQALSPGWAIGGWFIPLGWFVLPRIVAGGVWRASIPLQSQPVLRTPRTYLVTWWWLSFCVGQLLLATPVNTTRGDLVSWGDLVGSYSMSGVADLCRVASAVLGIVMIRKLTQMQQIRILQGPGVGHPYASPVIANAPYAAYAEPAPAAPFGVAAPLPGQAGPYGPAMGTPYAPSHPQAAPQSGYTPSVPQQAAPPRQDALPPTLAEPTAAPAAQPPAEPLAPPVTPPVVAPATEPLPVAEAAPEDAVPTDATPTDAVPTDAAPTDALPGDVPTAVLPRQVSKDRPTVLLTAVAATPQDPETTTPETATSEITMPAAGDAGELGGFAEQPKPEPHDD